MSTRMMKTKRKPRGGSCAGPVAGTPVFIVCFCALLILNPAAPGAPTSSEKKTAQSYALIAGTVFQPSGLSLPGATVTITPASPGNAGGKVKKAKKVRVASDARGEFAVRVPPVPMRYTVSVEASGFQPQSKEVAIQGDERVDLFVRLETAAK